MPDSLQYPPLPPDDLQRGLAIAQPDIDQTLPHIGVVGGTYTITISGTETNGRFCVIDMHIPPGGGPPSHRHDFEETFILLEGEIEATFRGKKSLVRAGETINIPSNAPHQFHNSSSKDAGCFAFALRPDRTISSDRLACRSQRAPPLLQNWIRKGRLSSSKRFNLSPPSTGPNS